MELRPGRRFEMSSHFIPLPRSSMMRASSSGDHLLCFLAGDSAECGGMLRFPPPLPGRGPDLELGLCPALVAAEALCPLAPAPTAAPARGDNAPGATANAASGGPLGGAVAVTDGGTEVDGACWVGDTGDSFESERLRREAISTMTVSRRDLPRGQQIHRRPGLCAQETVPALCGTGLAVTLRATHLYVLLDLPRSPGCAAR